MVLNKYSIHLLDMKVRGPKKRLNQERILLSSTVASIRINRIQWISREKRVKEQLKPFFHSF